MEGLLAADAVKLALLKNAEKLGLRGLVKVADFVEEEGASVGELELAAAGGGGAGKGALFVTE